MMLTSLVATLATTPFAIYHFDRAAAYSVLANLLAEPVVAFVIMPSAAFAVLAMPAGLDAGAEAAAAAPKSEASDSR